MKFVIRFQSLKLNTDLNALEHTLVEMFLLSKSALMLANSGSGFSKNIAYIFGQQYHSVF